MTTKEVAAKFDITGKELRRILRSFDRFSDGIYTRYNLNKRDIEQVAKALDNLAPKPTPKKKAKVTRKPKTTPITEAPAEQPIAA